MQQLADLLKSLLGNQIDTSALAAITAFPTASPLAAYSSSDTAPAPPTPPPDAAAAIPVAGCFRPFGGNVSVPSYFAAPPSTSVQQGKRHKAQHAVTLGHQQQQQQQQQQHGQYQQHQMLQQHLPQRQGICHTVPLPLQAPLQVANQYETPSHASYTQLLQGALEGHGEQGRLDVSSSGDSLLHSSVWDRVGGGVSVAGVTAAAIGGGDLLTSLDGLELADIEALLLNVEGELEFISSSMVSEFSQPHSQPPCSSTVCTIEPISSGMAISQLPEGLAPSVALGSSLFTPMHGGSEGSFASEGFAAVMAACHTASATGSSDRMCSKRQGALLLPTTILPALGSVSLDRTRADGAAEAGDKSVISAAGEARAATAGRIVDVSGDSQMGNLGLSSSKGTGRKLSPKRSREEDG
ncbi:unnamed protein product [Closterium sp. NIES-64]|nr:unnamed protein product [Closterium sp. NIES-64]